MLLMIKFHVFFLILDSDPDVLWLDISWLVVSSEALQQWDTSILRERREQQWSNLWLGLIGISFLLFVLSLLVGLFIRLHSQVQPGAAALRESMCTLS